MTVCPQGATAAHPEPQGFLPLPVFATVVAHAPLVALDWVVLRGQGAATEMLLGLRVNRPAQGFWFAPGGRVLKNERLQAAMARTLHTELGLLPQQLAALPTPVVPQWLGVFEHFYTDSFADAAQSTHYVVLAHVLRLPAGFECTPPAEQHTQWRWMPLAEVATSEQVHAHTRAYAQPAGGLCA